MRQMPFRWTRIEPASLVHSIIQERAFVFASCRQQQVKRRALTTPLMKLILLRRHGWIYLKTPRWASINSVLLLGQSCNRVQEVLYCCLWKVWEQRFNQEVLGLTRFWIAELLFPWKRNGVTCKPKLTNSRPALFKWAPIPHRAQLWMTWSRYSSIPQMCVAGIVQCALVYSLSDGLGALLCQVQWQIFSVSWGLESLKRLSEIL